jgi:hypothetical protein
MSNLSNNHVRCAPEHSRSVVGLETALLFSEAMAWREAMMVIGVRRCWRWRAWEAMVAMGWW